MGTLLLASGKYIEGRILVGFTGSPMLKGDVELWSRTCFEYYCLCRRQLVVYHVIINQVPIFA